MIIKISRKNLVRTGAMKNNPWDRGIAKIFEGGCTIFFTFYTFRQFKVDSARSILTKVY